MEKNLKVSVTKKYDFGFPPLIIKAGFLLLFFYSYFVSFRLQLLLTILFCICLGKTLPSVCVCVYLGSESSRKKCHIMFCKVSFPFSVSLPVNIYYF